MIGTSARSRAKVRLVLVNVEVAGGFCIPLGAKAVERADGTYNNLGRNN